MCHPCHQASSGSRRPSSCKSFANILSVEYILTFLQHFKKKKKKAAHLPPGAPRPGFRCTLGCNQLLAHLDPGQEGRSPELGQLTVSSRQCQVAPAKGQTAMSTSIQAGEDLILKRKTLVMFVLPLEPSDLGRTISVTSCLLTHVHTCTHTHSLTHTHSTVYPTVEKTEGQGGPPLCHGAEWPFSISPTPNRLFVPIPVTPHFSPSTLSALGCVLPH